jgi:glycosyltransferase involved in cell wall biosynthesis
MKPLISVIVIAESDSHLLHLTLESLSAQEEKNFEVVLLDATGKGTQIHSWNNLPLIYQEARRESLGEAMNQGLLLSQGEYVQFLFPGDRFLSQQATKYLCELAKESEWPEVIYCAYLLRDPELPPKAATFPLSLDLLRRGSAPTLPRAYWFLKSVLQQMGGFDVRCHYRPSFDLLCRMLTLGAPRIVSTRRVLTDYEWKKTTASSAVGYALETCGILYRHFGLWDSMRWIFVQDHLHVLRWSWKLIKDSFRKEF